jgi:hypothetical protein
MIKTVSTVLFSKPLKRQIERDSVNHRAKAAVLTNELKADFALFFMARNGGCGANRPLFPFPSFAND